MNANRLGVKDFVDSLKAFKAALDKKGAVSLILDIFKIFIPYFLALIPLILVFVIALIFIPPLESMEGLLSVGVLAVFAIFVMAYIRGVFDLHLMDYSHNYFSKNNNYTLSNSFERFVEFSLRRRDKTMNITALYFLFFAFEIPLLIFQGVFESLYEISDDPDLSLVLISFSGSIIIGGIVSLITVVFTYYMLGYIAAVFFRNASLKENIGLAFRFFKRNFVFLLVFFIFDQVVPLLLSLVSIILIFTLIGIILVPVLLLIAAVILVALRFFIVTETIGKQFHP